jgi:hypothetical protein
VHTHNLNAPLRNPERREEKKKEKKKQLLDAFLGSPLIVYMKILLLKQFVTT